MPIVAPKRVSIELCEPIDLWDFIPEELRDIEDHQTAIPRIAKNRDLA